MMTDVKDSMFNRAINVMGKSLGLRLSKHGMMTSNLANKDTPGYKVRDLDFEKTMQTALGPQEGKLELRQTNANHIPIKDVEQAYQAARKKVKFDVYGQDENGHDILDIDQEMVKLSKNHLMYNTTVQMLAKEFETLKYAITEGGR